MATKHSALAKLYYDKVTSKQRSLADVPAKWQDEVREMLTEAGLDPEDY